MHSNKSLGDKKWEAPESKSTVAEIELTLNVPNMTSGVS
jgi:hypothetical protein